jgi:predicted PurR-regulated permease PerM
MALPLREQAKYWGAAAVLFLVVLWLMGDVMLPFIVGGALAYFLDPVADRLQRLGLSRVMATTVITVCAILLVVLLVLSVIPSLISQLTALVNDAPQIAARMQAFLLERFPELSDSTSTARQTLAQIAQEIQSRGVQLANGLLTSALSIIGAVIFIIVVPVVTFYLLLDWDKLTARIDSLIRAIMPLWCARLPPTSTP